jgi:hypothetical protein
MCTEKSESMPEQSTPSTHEIVLSRAAVLATRKLFDYLTTEHMEAAGFKEHDITAFSELYIGVKEQCEEIEMGIHD